MTYLIRWFDPSRGTIITTVQTRDRAERTMDYLRAVGATPSWEEVTVFEGDLPA